MGKKRKKNKQNNKKTINNSNYNNITSNNVISDDTKINEKFELEESKKNNVEILFDFPYKKNIKQQSNKWKITTIMLIILSIILILVLINIKLKNNSKVDEKLCEVEKNIDEVEKNIDEEEKNNPKEDIKNEKNPKEKKYLFLGDSLFSLYNTSEYFRDYNTVNSGVSGITAYETYNVLEENVYAHNPDVVFMLLGTNDLYKEYSTVQTYENIKLIIDKIRTDRPEITINVLSLLPINTTDHWMINKEINANRTNQKIEEVNKYLKEYCDEKQINYINVHDTLLDQDSNLKIEYTKEGLHVNEIGYHFITNILLQYFK